MGGLMSHRGTRWILLVAITVVLALSAPSIGQSVVSEDWRATVPETTDVMLDLDAHDNVFVVGEDIQTVITRKSSQDGALLWQRVDPPPTERARASWISTDPAG